jgi:hypothetical protein
MRYSDFPDEGELRVYTRTFNARVKLLGRTQALSLEVLRGVILESGGVCGWCGMNLLNQDFEIDHIIALADKGAHSAENLVVACPSCNRQKASQPPLKFVLELVAKRGHSTPTIQRVLDFYGAEAKVQRGLWEE